MTSEGSLDKSAAAIRSMFAATAPRYDLLNRLLSARFDVAWRRRCAASLRLDPDDAVLDLCSGTGDQAVAVGRRGAGRIVAGDFCLPMLELAGRKFERLRRPPARLAADALELPFPDSSFDAVTVSFGLRNFADLDTGLGEIHRVLRPGGAARFLEFALPSAVWLRLPYRLYLAAVLPLLGALVSPDPGAYRYLPDSVVEFPQRGALARRMTDAGFANAAWDDFTGGIVCLYRGRAT